MIPMYDILEGYNRETVKISVVDKGEVKGWIGEAGGSFGDDDNYSLWYNCRYRLY